MPEGMEACEYQRHGPASHAEPGEFPAPGIMRPETANVLDRKVQFLTAKIVTIVTFAKRLRSSLATPPPPIDISAGADSMT